MMNIKKMMKEKRRTKKKELMIKKPTIEKATIKR